MKKQLTIEGFIDSLIKSIKKINSKDLDNIMNLKDPRLKKSILRLKKDKAYRDKIARKHGLNF